MEKTNVLFLLTPKTQLACLKDSMNVRQALEKMRAHGFTAIPLISEEGEYLGTISEGDLLWHIVNGEKISMEDLEETKITSLLRKNRFPAVKVDAEIGELVNLIINQNFVPVVDDRNVLMGIVTRRRVMQELFKN
ncbi:MAG: CBS domain-containing protein [Erysipelotrichaceae bacterium]|jgi:predicted transcriptional regulator|nr:CBS domain-containing protein [Erysipelotrichaceae bacterium]MBQ1322268.1 CBS domain-containing protein [Erysipelotrichaceae bacterium]MBQ1347403.1 CBS domain-containing protein [Erysipelotrichaceae bacterium]MBQ1624480.1 CBS domain-containing protein [Erysipelotrichaceae bacterium]MBQ1691758.1 CBS domain-containing protein [Erysipelotrichaceae bacterium]